MTVTPPELPGARTSSGVKPPRRLTRDAAAAELGKRWQTGDHLTMIGPTGRGKSTLLSQVIPHVDHDRVVIMCPKGADPAFTELGLGTKVWPPRRPWQEQLRDIWHGVPDRQAERPIVWRLEIDIRSVADFGNLATQFKRVLDGALARPQKPPPPDSLMVVIDDSRMVSDPKFLGLSSEVVGNLLIGRAKRVSMVNMYQAPRWVPREGLDQATHIVMWKNKDRDVVARLAEIMDLDRSEITSALAGLGFHDSLWLDVRADELFIIGA